MKRYYHQILWIIQEECVVHFSTLFQLLTRTAQVKTLLFREGRGARAWQRATAGSKSADRGGGWHLTPGKTLIFVLRILAVMEIKHVEQLLGNNKGILLNQ